MADDVTQVEVAKVGVEPFDASGMVSAIVKSLSGSSQLSEATSTGVWDGSLTIEPPIPPEQMWALTELNAYHGACIQAKATDSFGRGWSVYTVDDEEIDPDTTKAIRPILDDLVAGGWTFQRLWYETGREFDGIGWALVEVTRDESGVINGLFPLPAQTFRVAKIGTDEEGNVVKVGGELGKVWVQKRDEKTRYFVRFAPDRENQPVIDRETGRPMGDEESEEFEERRATEVLPILFPSPRTSYYGVPDWVSASGAIAELASIRSFNEAFFDSNGMVDQIVHVTGSSVSAAKAVKDEIKAAFTETKGRAHVKVFVASDDSIEIKVEPLSSSAREGQTDRQFDDGTLTLVKEVLIGHQVPPYRIGWAEVGSLGGNVAKEMLEAYRFGVVEPRQNVFQAAIKELLSDASFAQLGLSESQEIRFTDVDWDAWERDLEMVNEGVDRGALNRDEWRAAMGFEPTNLPEMQDFLVDGKPIGEDAEGMLQAFHDNLRTASGFTGEEEPGDDLEAEDDVEDDS